MLRALSSIALLLVTFAAGASAHAPPTPLPVGPLHVEDNRLVDATPRTFLLRGVQMSGLNVVQPSATQIQTVEAMTPFTFRVIRQRWNMNALRLPVSVALWQRDRDAYLDKVSTIVRDANQEGLVVVLAAFDDRSAGLPGPAVLEFWKAWAAFFKDDSLVIFDLFNEPIGDQVPGHVAGQHSPADWQFWRNGGTLANGDQAVGMQNLVDAIRGSGATQIIAVPGFQDALDFRGFGPDFYLRDPNILLEVHPYFDHDATDEDRFANFGFLGNRFPLYAGEWGLQFDRDSPACTAVPRDLQKSTELLFQITAYFDLRSISWTAASFEPAQLIIGFTDFTPTTLDRLWTCGETLSPPPGMGQFVLLWMTGDPGGFGYITADLIANAAGGPASPIAPGEIVAIYGQGLGPEVTATGGYDDSGALETTVAEVQVLFDGVPAPIFAADLFQVTVQAPYEIAGKQRVSVQEFYRSVPSNKVELQVVESAPEIFRRIGSNDAAAFNQDGSPNSQGNPAEQGSMILLSVSGAGQTSPPGVTGKRVQDPSAQTTLPASLTIGGQPAPALQSAAAPGMVGVLQVIAHVPTIPQVTGVVRVPLVLTIGGRSSQAAATLWIR